MASSNPFDIFNDEMYSVKPKEWALAKKYLVPNGDLKLPRGNKQRSINGEIKRHYFGQESFKTRHLEKYGEQGAQELQALHHSMLHIDGKLLAVLPHTPELSEGKVDPAIVGAGNFGKVKYAIDENNQPYVVKIETKGVRQASDDEYHCMQEVGWDVRTAERVLPKGQKQRYTIIPYLGKTSSHLAKDATSKQQDKKNLEVAIKLAWQVHSAHQGWLSNQGRPIAHRDIKPENVTLNQDGRVHLIDWGLAKRGVNLKDKPKILVGSLLFLPPEPMSYSYEQLDIIALQRTIYVPENIPTTNFQGKTNHETREDEDKCFVTDQFMNDNELEDVLGTEYTDPTQELASPSMIAASIAISELDLPIQEKRKLRERIDCSNDQQQALMAIYFSGLLSDLKEDLSKLLDDDGLVNALSQLAPTIEKKSLKEPNNIIFDALLKLDSLDMSCVKESTIKRIILNQARSDNFEGLTSWTLQKRATGLRELENLEDYSSLNTIKNILATRQRPENYSRGCFSFFSVEGRRHDKVQEFYTNAFRLINQFEKSQEDLYQGRRRVRFAPDVKTS